MRRILVLLIVLASIRANAACPSTPGTITYTPIKQNPQIGVGVADVDYAQAFCLWAEADEAQRAESRHYILRPPASAAIRSKLFGVDDCNTTACTSGGGSTHCLTIVNDSNAWEVVGCFGASTADVSSSIGTAVLNQVARFADTTGKLIKNATCQISDAGIFGGGTCSLTNNIVTPNSVLNTGQSAGLCPSIVNGTTWAWSVCGGVSSLTCGAGMSCSPSSPITGIGTLATASDTQNFVKATGLSCGAGTNGKVAVGASPTPMSYCDNTSPPTLRYAAYGNSSGVATGALGQGDITTEYGLTCDGSSSTGEHGALQTVIDNGTAAGRTIRVPPGKVCTIGATVVPKSNVNFHCEAGAGFKAVGTITGAMFASATTVNDMTFDGCTFDLNGKVGITAFSLSGGNTGGTRWHFWRNTIKGVGTGTNSAYNLVRLDCTAAGLSAGQCDIIGNTFIGSATPATTDTCLAVQGSGVGNLGATGTPVVANHFESCGADGIAIVEGALTIVANEFAEVQKNAISIPFPGGGTKGENTTVVANQLDMATGGTCMRLYGGHNFNISDNQCTSGGDGIVCIGTPGGQCARNRITDNYVPSDIKILSEGTCSASCTGHVGDRCMRDVNCTGGSCGAGFDGCGSYSTNDGNYVSGNILQAQTGQTAGVTCENCTNSIIQGNHVNQLATTIPFDMVRVSQLDANPDGPLIISGNSNTGGSGTGLHRCVAVEAPETLGDGGTINDLVITGNTCGQGDIGVDLGSGATAPAGGSGLVIRSNSFRQDVTTMAGFPGNFDTGFPPEDVIGQRGNLRNVGWQRDSGTTVSTAGAGLKAVGTSVDPVAITGSSVLLWQADFADLAQAFFVLFNNSGGTDVGGWAWPISSATAMTAGIARQWKPLINMVIKTPNVDAFQRYWCGFFSKTDVATVPGTNNPTGVAGAGFRFDGVSDTSPCQTGTACWRTWSNDGTSTGVSTTPTVGGLIDGNTRYVLTMDMSSGTDIKYYANGTLIATHSSDIPAGNTMLGWLCSVTNESALSHQLGVSSTYVEYPF